MVLQVQGRYNDKSYKAGYLCCDEEAYQKHLAWFKLEMQILTFLKSLSYLEFSLEGTVSISGEMFCSVQLKQCEAGKSRARSSHSIDFLPIFFSSLPEEIEGKITHSWLFLIMFLFFIIWLTSTFLRLNSTIWHILWKIWVFSVSMLARECFKWQTTCCCLWQKWNNSFWKLF